jgi:hypothetical protein
MGNREAAEREIRYLPSPAVTLQSPQAAAPPSSKLMAERSLEAGYLSDALRYLHAANEEDPADFDVMLKLGRTYNNLQEDRAAVRWFALARRSPDPRTASEAALAYGNLAPSLRLLRTTVWALPMLSTRWRNAFAYAQAKVELRRPYSLRGVKLSPYLSARFIGDVRGQISLAAPSPAIGLTPQFLSERSVILAAGVATSVMHGAVLWFEAGGAVRYQTGPGPRSQKDLRGGVSYTKTVRRGKAFAETTDDGLFLSRFNNDALVYSQNRTGWTWNDSVQVHWNWNITADAKREYWANTVETGPGVRWKLNPMVVTVNWLRGAYLLNAGNPFRPNYSDLRIGIWYAFSR